MIRKYAKSWWKWLRYEPNDPRFSTGKVIKIAVIGGGTGLSNLLRGLKEYSNHISAIVTVADGGGSTGVLRKEFDMLAPGDIRRCIGALAHNEDLFSDLWEYRFEEDNKLFGGHTLGNIWITALTNHYGSFEKAIEVTSEIFQTAGRVLPSTLDNVNLRVEYEDGTVVDGEHHLDEVVKKIKKISLDKKGAKAYDAAVAEILTADLIVIGPGSLYGSIIPNLIIHGISEAITANKKAVKIYVANCSTERTQTRNYLIDDHIRAIREHAGKELFDYCLVNNKIISQSKDETKIGEVNNITTDKDVIDGVKIIKEDLISRENPLFHDSDRLAKSIIDLYNNVR